MINLSKCKQNETVIIVKVQGKGMIRRRLLEMGFMKGAVLKIIKYAPLRDPMEVVLGESHLSLRLKEAALIQVKSEVKKAVNEFTK
jgi:Fe2+ transport system protein FeoA